MPEEKKIWSSVYKGQVGEYKKFRELTPAEWHLVAKQFAYALFIVPMAFQGVLAVALHPDVADKAAMGLDALKKAVASKMPDNYSIRQMETPSGKVISIIDKRAEKAGKPLKMSLEIILPSSGPRGIEEQVTFQFRGLKLPDINELLDDTPSDAKPIQSGIQRKSS